MYVSVASILAAAPEVAVDYSVQTTTISTANAGILSAMVISPHAGLEGLVGLKSPGLSLGLWCAGLACHLTLGQLPRCLPNPPSSRRP